MVIVETAIAIPVLVVVTAALIWGLLVASAQLAVSDAARSAARDLARGVPLAQALAEAEASVPGAHAVMDDLNQAVAVVVTKEVHAPVPLISGLSFTVGQRVAVPREWL